MNNIVLTIIIPHYNSPELLRRLLHSIPCQDGIQTIVVDDLSNKYINQFNLLKQEYNDSVEFYDNTPDNKNAGGARNVGLEYATGKWVMFADADDMFLSTFWTDIQEYLNAEEDIIFFPPVSKMINLESSSNRFLEFAKYAIDYCYDKKYGRNIKKSEWMLRLKWVSPWSKMIRRSLIEENDIRFETTRYSNDYFFSVKAGIRAKSVTASYKQIYCITEGIGTLTTGSDPKEKEIREDVIKRCQKIKNKEVPFRIRLMTGELYWDRMLVESITNNKLPVFSIVYKIYRHIRYGR